MSKYDEAVEVKETLDLTHELMARIERNGLPNFHTKFDYDLGIGGQRANYGVMPTVKSDDADKIFFVDPRVGEAIARVIGHTFYTLLQETVKMLQEELTDKVLEATVETQEALKKLKELESSPARSQDLEVEP